jgi:hypothetical protein
MDATLKVAGKISLRMGRFNYEGTNINFSRSMNVFLPNQLFKAPPPFTKIISKMYVVLFPNTRETYLLLNTVL